MSLIGNMNLFQATGDTFHLLAILILIVSIWKKKTCHGISGKTQILFGLVFTSRYLDLFTNFVSVYNTSAKVIFILLTYFTIYSIYWQFRSKENRELDSFRAEILVVVLFGLSFIYNYEFSVLEISWAFSEYLEAVAVVPQLFMIKKIGHAENHVVYYLFALAAYKALYICNWIYKYCSYMFLDNISVYSGCIQTLILFIGVWLAHSSNWKPKYKDLVPQVAVIPSPLFKTEEGEEIKEKVIPTISSLTQSAEVIDADDKMPLYSPDA